MNTTQARKFIDCREFPNMSNCTLTIFGTEEEVLRAAREHALSSHSHHDGPELLAALRSCLRDDNA